MALQGKLRAWLTRRAGRQANKPGFEAWAMLPVGLAAIYGGYFGAGLSVIVLAVLALVIDDSLTRLNALKQAIAFSVNIAAAIFFVFSGQVFVASGGGDGRGRAGGRRTRRQAGRQDQAHHATLDRGLDRRRGRGDLSGALDASAAYTSSSTD